MDYTNFLLACYIIRQDNVQDLYNLENKNSSGHDGISNMVLKYIKLELSNSLTLIVNQMLTTGIFRIHLKSLKLPQCLKRRFPFITKVSAYLIVTYHIKNF